MHFEILVEDASGEVALKAILPKVLPPGGEHTFRIKKYKGVGHIPKGLKADADPAKRLLLNNLPRLLSGYGHSSPGLPIVVLVVLDLDKRLDCRAFKQELVGILNACQPRPHAYFRIAIEEMEAWFLGDQAAVAAAYPRAKRNVLASYEQDSICGTWEKLADAIHAGGSAALRKGDWITTGTAKCEWAAKIGPQMNVATNLSPSFRVFRDLIQRLCLVP